MIFNAVIERDLETGLLVGSVPGIPGAHTQGETIEEVRVNLAEVIELLQSHDRHQRKGLSVQTSAFARTQAYHARMLKPYFVRAEWDADAGVWVASSDDVPGLVTESETLEALDTKLQTLVPELLEANGCLPSDKIIHVELLARRFSTTNLAAA